MAKQLSLIKEPRRNTKLWWITKQTTYGGSLNYRKVARPHDSKKLTHAVFKAQLGTSLRFTRFPTTVRKILMAAAKTYGIRIRDVAINHDHIHILFSAGSRDSQSQFMRLFAAELGRRYARLRRKLGLAARPLWLHRPFTRLVSWGRKSVEKIVSYIRRNRHEALGFIAYRPRSKTRHDTFLAKWEWQQRSSA